MFVRFVRLKLLAMHALFVHACMHGRAWEVGRWVPLVSLNFKRQRPRCANDAREYLLHVTDSDRLT